MENLEMIWKGLGKKRSDPVIEVINFSPYLCQPLLSLAAIVM